MLLLEYAPFDPCNECVNKTIFSHSTHETNSLLKILTSVNLFYAMKKCSVTVLKGTYQDDL